MVTGRVERVKQFEALYLEMYHKLLHYALQNLDQNYSLAEEAVQDTFRIFWVKYDEAMLSQNPRGWIFKTLKWEIANIKRARAKLANLLIILSTTPLGTGFAQNEPSLDTEYGDLKENPHYQLLKEFVLEHRTVKELAQSRGITITACKKRIQRAKEYLQKYFKENQV